MNILGISSFYHDSAACLLKDGDITAAVQEERYTRRKHDPGFPVNAINYCLKENSLSIDEIDYIAFYDKPFVKFERILETYLSFAPLGISSFIKAMPVWIKQKIWIPEVISKQTGFDGRILFSEHHESHAASAFFPSPFERAAFLTLDGVGEWTTASYGVGKDNRVELISELHFPHSLGLFYSAFTYFAGFKVNSGEYKLMGLAPYGEPKYVDIIYDNLIDLKEDGSISLNMNYFNYCSGLKMTGRKFNKLFNGPPRKPEERLTQREMDIACSVQRVTEEIIFRMVRHVKKETGEKNLCLAGGVALNCSANGKLLNAGIFDDIWIQPAAGDAGGALGAAYIVHYHYLNNAAVEKRGKDLQKATCLGNGYEDCDIDEFLKKYKLPNEKLDEEYLLERVSDLLIDEKVIGWFQGRMEFGPRALGNRSIIGDARSPSMQKKMNLKIKYRESFRPFAPSVLAEKISDWFEIDRESPYMLFVADIKKEKQRDSNKKESELCGIDKLSVVRSEIPAVTHVDYSARIQSVNRKDNPKYHRLIKKFYDKTGCPLIINTSFNVRGEPIVESPMDAYKCFMRTEMDVLVLGSYILYKRDQKTFHPEIDWRQMYERD